MVQGVGIIGYPIRHSISPVFQQAALDHHSLDATYQAWEVTPEGLGDFMAELRRADALGINVTVPHKEAVIPYLDEVDGWASDAGAVNTVHKDGGALVGHNTDGIGFVRALEGEAGFAPRGSRALIVGAGGSGRAVALALARSGVASITIANRTLRRAGDLADAVSGRGASPGPERPPEVEPISLERIAEAASSVDLIVNCTTLGMRHGPDEAASPLKADHIPSNALVYDLVYNPPDTPLLMEARKAGAATLGGLAMLVYQGAAAFEYWTGVEAPVEVMMKAARAAL
ncbi:MAG: shikimate dehydrogenase [Dehalococcoidia bacterium]|nr:shikimate dehydrogenase [Dehalococcoidia bacterium]